MADDRRYSKRDLLGASLKKLGEVGATATEFAVDRFADRFTPRVCRPPGAVGEVEFLVACTRCDACIKACPPGAILKLSNQAGLASGTPFLDANKYRPCVACEDTPCIKACPTGALLPTPIEQAVIGSAHLMRERCDAWQGEECALCVKACPYPDDAIITDEQGRPYIDPRSCIGCGRCVAACPTKPKAIRIDPPPRF